MKHEHSDVNLKVELPTQDLEKLIDQLTDAALTIIAAGVAAHILKRVFKENHELYRRSDDLVPRHL